jgi:hypothetical protein
MSPTKNPLVRYLQFAESRRWVAHDALPVFSRLLRSIVWSMAAVFVGLYAFLGPIVRGDDLRSILLVTLWWIFLFFLWAGGAVALFTLIFRLASRETPGKLTNRYLDAVSSYLPADQHEDIVTELAANIRSQVEDREAELGRSLTAEEVEVILKHHGHPMLVAGRYLPRQHLIGPATFPFYWFTLKTALWITALVYVIVAVSVPFIASLIRIAGHPVPHEMSYPGPGYILFLGAVVLFAVYGAVTAVFAVLETFLGRFLASKWTVRSLSGGAAPNVESRWEWIAALIAGGLFTAGWIVSPNFPWLVGPAARYLTPGPAWPSIRVWLLLLVLAAMVEAGVRLARPRWTRIPVVLRVARHAAGYAFLVFLIQASDSVVALNSSLVPAAKLDLLVPIIGKCTFYVPLLILSIAATSDLFKCLPYLRRWFLRSRAAAPFGAG